MLIKHILNLNFSLVDFNLHPRLYALQSNLSGCLKTGVFWENAPEKKVFTTFSNKCSFSSYSKLFGIYELIKTHLSGVSGKV